MGFRASGEGEGQGLGRAGAGGAVSFGSKEVATRYYSPEYSPPLARLLQSSGKSQNDVCGMPPAPRTALCGMPPPVHICVACALEHCGVLLAKQFCKQHATVLHGACPRSALTQPSHSSHSALAQPG